MDQREKNVDMEEVLRTAMYARAAEMYTSLPAIVQSVNAAGTRVEVQPAIMEEAANLDGTFTRAPISVLVDVMVLRVCSGGFALTMPILPGDECILHFANRCIDNWAAHGGIQPQAEIRLHSISDGFAFFGPQSDPSALTAINQTTAQLRTRDGLTYVEITPGGSVNIVAPAGTTLTTTNSVRIVAPSGVTIVGNLNVIGTVTHL